MKVLDVLKSKWVLIPVAGGAALGARWAGAKLMASDDFMGHLDHAYPKLDSDGSPSWSDIAWQIAKSFAESKGGNGESPAKNLGETLKAVWSSLKGTAST